MAAVVPLAPLVDGPPPVPNVLLLIVPTVISSSSINIVSPAVIPVALSTSIAVSLLSNASANCVVKAPAVVPPNSQAPQPVPPTCESRPAFIKYTASVPLPPLLVSDELAVTLTVMV